MCLDFFLGEIQCSPSGFRERRRKFCPTPLGVQSRYKCKESGNKAVCTPDRFPALFHIFEIYSQDQEAPLHLAVKNNHIPVIHCLLSAGCDTNAIDKVPAAQYSNSWMNTSSIKCVCCSTLLMVRGPRPLCTSLQTWPRSMSWRCSSRLNLIKRFKTRFGSHNYDLAD